MNYFYISQTFIAIKFPIRNVNAKFGLSNQYFSKEEKKERHVHIKLRDSDEKFICYPLKSLLLLLLWAE